MTLILESNRLFLLDTNVLMHDPSAFFRFQEHAIFLPMMVLEELDKGKKGMSEVARNARQASRFLDRLMCGAEKSQIDEGLPLTGGDPISGGAATGRLYFQTEHLPNVLPDALPGNSPDNHILGTALALQQRHPDCQVTLISKDINLRIKAALLGIHAEDYHNDQVLDDVSLLYRGEQELDKTFWETRSRHLESWQEHGHTYYRIRGPEWNIGTPTNACMAEATKVSKPLWLIVRLRK